MTQDHTRLSDKILEALKIAVEQKDVGVADGLTKALELSITRNTGGGEFVERRDYPPEIEAVLTELDRLRDNA